MRELNIDREAGNAFMLIATASSWFKQLAAADIYNANVIEKYGSYDNVLKEMQSDDYKNVLKIFTEVFTDEMKIAILVNNDGESIDFEDY